MVNSARAESQRGWSRSYRERNLDRERVRQRERAHVGKHGITRADRVLMLQEQDGCCYLCGDEITLETSVIEHDHRCHPKGRTCAVCRRGLACAPCNTAIGAAFDDPARLRRIADNLETAIALVNERLDGKPKQLNLM